MKGPLANAHLQRPGSTRRRRCHARASGPRGASTNGLTHESSWISSGSIGRSRATAIAKSSVDSAINVNDAGLEDFAGTRQSIDSNRRGVSVSVGVPTVPPNKRVNATVRPVTPRACARVAPSRPARYAQRSTDLKALA